MRSLTRVQSCATLLLLIYAASASAATYVVRPDGTGDFPTIQAAIDAVSAGDTIELTDGTFTGSGNRDISVSKTLTLRAQNGPGGSCIIDCEGSSSDPHFGFEIGDDASGTYFEGITIQNAWILGDGAAVNAYETIFEVEGCIFWNNFAEYNGGAIYGVTGSELYATDCLFSGNRTNQYGTGGAISIDDVSYAELNGCTFNANWGDLGGTLYFAGASAGYLSRCTIDSSDGPMSNAAIYSVTYSQVEAENMIIAFGTDKSVRCATNGSIDLYCCDVYGNEGGDWIGCIADQYGTNGNISVDPHYCWPYGAPFGLAENSPCAEENNEICGQIGAWGIECGPAVFEVRADGAGEYPTIQGAIDAAESGSIIELADGTYTGDGNRDLDCRGKTLTIRSQSGNASSCVIDCGGGPGDPHRGFDFHQGEGPECVVENLRVTGGYVEGYTPEGWGGGFRCSNYASPTFRSCQFRENEAVYGGGGYCDTMCTVTVEDCLFLGNQAVSIGGGMRCAHTNMDLAQTAFQANTALIGAGLYLDHATASVVGCNFSSNIASGFEGGGVVVGYSDEMTTFEGCEFVSNVARYGAGLYGLNTPLSLNDCTFHQNTAVGGDPSAGGAVTFNGNAETLNASGCTFTFNQAETGGAIDASTVSLILTDCHFSNNTASTPGIYRRGGGIYARDVHASMSFCTFEANESDFGGGIYLSGPDGTQIEDCVFSGNVTAHGSAATIIYEYSSSLFRRCTFSDNHGDGDGGALTFAYAPSVVEECRFEYNSGQKGGAIYSTGASCGISTSTFVGCTADSGGTVHLYTAAINMADCTIAGSHATSGGAVEIVGTPAGDYEIENTIIAFGTSGGAIHCAHASLAPTLTCCDLYDNTGGDWTGYIAGQYGTNGNISEDPLFCGSENPEEPYTLDADSPCAAENNPACGRIGAWPVGCGTVEGIGDGTPAGDALYLSPARPNPTAGAVGLSYVTPTSDPLTQPNLGVYDAAGRLVRRPVSRGRAPGRYDVVWDGRDFAGRPVNGGIYYIRLEVGGERFTRSVTIIR